MDCFFLPSIFHTLILLYHLVSFTILDTVSTVRSDFFSPIIVSVDLTVFYLVNISSNHI